MNTVSEVLISVVIVVAIVLFNFLAPRLARWQQEQERLRGEALARVQPPVTLEAVAPPIAIAYRTAPSAADLGVTSGTESAAAAPRRGATVRSYLADRRKLRQAIIVATVLGPCRAQEPRDLTERILVPQLSDDAARRR